ELHPFDAERLVAHSHNLTLGRFRADLKTVGQRLTVNDERMVAGSLEGIRQIAENRTAVVSHHRRFAMHQTFGADDFTTKGDSERLMAKANPQQRQLAAEILDGLYRDTGLFRRTGA